MAATTHTQSIPAPEALQLLKEGNDRFSRNVAMNRDHLEKVKATANGQNPFAAVLGCMDSRAPGELVFDQGIGDIFNLRVAGNVVSTHVLGSLEYAVAVVKVRLIVVLGHTGCGAVKGACDHVDLGNLTELLEEITPCLKLEPEPKDPKKRTSKNTEFVNRITELNVYRSVEQILAGSQIIRDAVTVKGDEHVEIVPAIYDVATGKVNFLKKAPAKKAAKAVAKK